MLARIDVLYLGIRALAPVPLLLMIAAGVVVLRRGWRVYGWIMVVTAVTGPLLAIGLWTWVEVFGHRLNVQAGTALLAMFAYADVQGVLAAAYFVTLFCFVVSASRKRNGQRTSAAMPDCPTTPRADSA